MIRVGIAAFLVALTTGVLLVERPGRASPETAQEEVEAAIHAVHAEMRQAAQALDAPGLYSHVLDGETPPIIEDGQLSDTWAGALEGTARDFRGLSSVSYTYTRESITVISPTTALWVGVGTASAVLADGRQIDAPFAESMVFVQRGGQWKILHAHRSAPNRP